MKQDASTQELLTFAASILNIYKDSNNENSQS